jgi:NTP pyrophosphatase (non-canonical NTP hydrolase)
MHLNEYGHAAMSLRLDTADSTYALYNLVGEVGELMSKEAKLIRDGGNLAEHREAVLKELGDILWCLTAVAQDYRFSLEDVAKGNLEKLNKRKTNNTIQGNGDNR